MFRKAPNERKKKTERTRAKKTAETFTIRTMTKFIEFRWKWYSCVHFSLFQLFCRLHFTGICTRSFSMRAWTNNERANNKTAAVLKTTIKDKKYCFVVPRNVFQVIVLMRHIVSLHCTVHRNTSAFFRVFFLFSLDNIKYMSLAHFRWTNLCRTSAWVRQNNNNKWLRIEN